MTAVDMAAAEKPSLWRRLGFGYAHIPCAEEADGWAPGELTTEVRIVLDWKDRLRVLVSGKVSVMVRTQTDVIVERARSRSAVRVMAPTDR